MDDGTIEDTEPDGTVTNTRLDGAKLQLTLAEARKTALEAQLLAYQLEPAHRRLDVYKSLAGASGLLVALVSVLGALGSVTAWYFNQAREQEIRVEERLAHGLAGLSDISPSRRAASLALLKSFVGRSNPQRERQIVSAVVEALQLEGTPEVSNSIAEFLRGLDPSDRSTLDVGLASLAEKSRRALRAERFERANYRAPIPKLRYLADGMEALLHNGARADLSGVDLSAANLASLNLVGLRFAGAFLVDTNFEDARAKGADFSNADLSGTIFRDADLSGANFSQPARGWPMQRYAMRRFSDGDRIYGASFPDFTCANLTDADFSWHPLVLMERDRKQAQIGGFPPIFDRARVDGANFERLTMFGLAPKGFDKWPFRMAPGPDNAGTSVGAGKELLLTQFPIDPEADLEDSLPVGPSFNWDFSPFADSYSNIRSVFGTANWEKARFPKSVRQILENQWLVTSVRQPRCKHEWASDRQQPAAQQGAAPDGAPHRG